MFVQKAEEVDKENKVDQKPCKLSQKMIIIIVACCFVVLAGIVIMFYFILCEHDKEKDHYTSKSHSFR